MRLGVRQRQHDGLALLRLHSPRRRRHPGALELAARCRAARRRSTLLLHLALVAAATLRHLEAPSELRLLLEPAGLLLLCAPERRCFSLGARRLLLRQAIRPRRLGHLLLLQLPRGCPSLLLPPALLLRLLSLGLVGQLLPCLLRAPHRALHLLPLGPLLPPRLLSLSLVALCLRQALPLLPLPRLSLRTSCRGQLLRLSVLLPRRGPPPLCCLSRQLRVVKPSPALIAQHAPRLLHLSNRVEAVEGRDAILRLDGFALIHGQQRRQYRRRSAHLLDAHRLDHLLSQRPRLRVHRAARGSPGHTKLAAHRQHLIEVCRRKDGLCCPRPRFHCLRPRPLGLTLCCLARRLPRPPRLLLGSHLSLLLGVQGLRLHPTPRVLRLRLRPLACSYLCRLSHDRCLLRLRCLPRPRPLLLGYCLARLLCHPLRLHRLRRLLSRLLLLLLVRKAPKHVQTRYGSRLGPLLARSRLACLLVCR